MREYGRAPRAELVYAERSGRKFDRENTIAAWNAGKIVAPMGYKCSCDSVLVESWVSEVLVPELPPDSVVVFDNASFHNRKRLTKLLEDANCRLIFLPPYSPDLNPIEHFWDWMKNKVRDTAYLYENLELAIMAAVNSR